MINWVLGCDRGYQHARATPLLGHEDPLAPKLGMTPLQRCPLRLLGGSIVDSNALLRSYIWHCIAIPLIAGIFMGRALLEGTQDGGISGHRR